jgi:hypothetical protein
MRAVFAVLTACLILFSLTSGAGASAAVPCQPPATESLLHFDGDADEVPSCPVNSAAHHHHASCSADHFAAAQHTGAIAPVALLRAPVAMSRDFLPPGHEPGSELDPPRA